MQPKVKDEIRVLPYNPEWRDEFQRIRSMLLECIGDIIISVEHVGSTSIEGLAAKPIIDIDVVMESYELLPIIVKRLELIGFKHEGNLEIEGREAFKRTVEDDFMPYHLYVCPKDGKGYLEHIAFRDYLRENPEIAEAYGQLKKELADKFRFDREGYCNAKSDFCTEVLRQTSIETLCDKSGK